MLRDLGKDVSRAGGEEKLDSGCISKNQHNSNGLEVGDEKEKKGVRLILGFFLLEPLFEWGSNS